jgi:HK97 family phage major capsid protein
MKKELRISAEQARSASFVVTGDGEEKDFCMSISSDEPYMRMDWDGERYYEVLDHTPGGMDDSRLKAGLPILFNHSRDQHLGRATKYINDGKKCTVSGMIWSESAFAQGKKADAMSGALPDTSVGYRITDDGKQIGKKDGVPIIRFKWAIHEASLVTIPADTSVGVGRAREAGQEPDLIAINLQKEFDADGKEVQTQVTGTKEPDQKMNLNNLPKRLHEAADDANGAAKIDVVAERNTAVTQERQRVAQIQELAKHFREKGMAGRKIETDECASKHIAEGKTVDDFQKAVMLGNFSEVKENNISNETGISEKEAQEFSIIKCFRQLIRPNGRLEGRELRMCEAAEKASGRSVTGLGFMIPPEVMRAEFSKEMQRALVTNVFSAAGALVGTDLLGGSLIELLRNKMGVLRMGARVLGGLQGNVSIPLQSGGATASWLSETATLTESPQAVGQLNLTPHKLAASTAFSTQLLAQASVDAEAFVRNDLMQVIAIARDLAAIAGSGNSGQPLGILNAASLSTSVTFANAQTMLYSDALAFENNVAINNADLGSLGYMTTPTVRKNAKATAEISAANSIPVWKDNMVNGFPAFATNQVPTATSVIFGNWNDLILAEWPVNEVIVDPYSLSMQQQIRVVMHMLCDNGLRHSKSFSVSTN